MVENEAIVQLNFDMEMIRFNPETGETLTLEQIKAQNEANYKTYLADEMAITALIEIQQYRAIGTVEELQALKEKNEPRKIKGKRFVEAICPWCESELFETYWAFGGIHHCSNCGSAIDWQ